MPYIGKPQSADPITVNTSNIDDGTIQAVDISSSFAGHISGSFGNQRVGTTDDVLFNEVTASGVISGSSVNARTISNDAGDLTIDSAGDVVIDADGADVKLKDDGTEFGRISRVSSDLVIKSISNNNDILFKGVDDSATITALTLDMSEAGDATFNRSISASSISTGSIGRLQTHQANALFGSNTLTLGGDLTTAGTFTTQNNNVTVNAVGAARTLTLNESLTVGDGNDGTITFSGASKTLTVEENSNVNQDLTTDASPTFAAGTITGDFAVGGTLTAQEVHTEFESASILFTSGSTQFGNSSDDVHDFKGNTISGSATSTGSFGMVGIRGLPGEANSRLGINGNIEMLSGSNRLFIPRASDGALTLSVFSRTGNNLTLSGAGSSTGNIEFIPSSANSSAVAMTIDENQNFPYGLNESPFNSNNIASLFSRNLTILIGQNDNDPNAPNLRRNSIVDLQGNNRFDRAEYFYTSAENLANEKNYIFNWQKFVVPNAAHDLSPIANFAVDLLYQ